jgi:hypothetical protein
MNKRGKRQPSANTKILRQSYTAEGWCIVFRAAWSFFDYAGFDTDIYLEMALGSGSADLGQRLHNIVRNKPKCTHLNVNFYACLYL